MFDRVQARLAAMPFVTAVGAINHLPLAGDTWRMRYWPDDRPVPPPQERPTAIYRVVRPGYFAAMALPLVAGRDVASTDTASSLPVAVINQVMAERQWPGESAVGRRLHLPGPSDVQTVLTVVGVAANARQSDWTSPPDDEVYVAFAQRSSEPGLSSLTFVLRTTGDPAAAAASIPREIAMVDRGPAVSASATMASIVADDLWRPRLTSRFTGAFAGIALGLAVIGIYAVVAGAVARRRREFGVRLALGATAGTIQRLAVTAVFGPVCWGAAVGLAATAAGAGLLRTMVYDVSVLDGYAIGGSVLVLLTAALGAAWLPARRASRLDPTVALRDE
jgi:predicted permease